MRRAALAMMLGVTFSVPARARASFFEESMQEIQRKLTSVDRPGLALPNNEPRQGTRSEILPAAAGEEERRLRLFQDLQVRRGGAAAQVVGSGLPIDMVSGVLPGTLLAMRVGGQTKSVGGYLIFGGGTFTTYRHAIPRRDVDPVIVNTHATPFGFIGIGTELHLYRGVLLGGEVNMGNILDRNGGERLIAPDPSDRVRSAAVTLRVDY